MNIQENKLSVNVPANTIKLKDIKPMNTQNTVTLIDQVIEQLKDLSDSSLQIAHNNYCNELGYEDNIYYNDEYDINQCFKSAFDALRSMQHYNLSDDYFYFHNGNLISFNYLTSEESPITFSELAQWIIDNESYNEYDIDVVTWLDMKDSIEDNIADDENLLNKLADYLTVELGSDYGDNVDLVMNEVDNYSYEGLQEIIMLLGINQ